MKFYVVMVVPASSNVWTLIKNEFNRIQVAEVKVEIIITIKEIKVI